MTSCDGPPRSVPRRAGTRVMSGRYVATLPAIEKIDGLHGRFVGRAALPGAADPFPLGPFLPPDAEGVRLLRIRQVHRGRVVAAWEATGGPLPLGREADGAVTDLPGVFLRVAVADCLALFLADPDLPSIALVHAGWKGLAEGVVPAAVRLLAEHESPPDRLVASIGPSIGPCCYEVGEEVIQAVGKYAITSGRSPRGRPMLDLYGSARKTLIGEGLDPARIDERPPCTSCADRHWHSYRTGAAGRNVALLGRSAQEIR